MIKIQRSTIVFNTILGNFLLKIFNNKIKSLYPTNYEPSILVDKRSAYIVKNIKNYLNNKSKIKNFTSDPKGTNFEKKVWNEIKKINFGDTMSYSEIANKIKSSPRAVGNACANNPCLLIIPCHRVINLNGNTGNYVIGSEIKKFLLNLEKNLK